MLHVTLPPWWESQKSEGIEFPCFLGNILNFLGNITVSHSNHLPALHQCMNLNKIAAMATKGGKLNPWWPLLVAR